MTVHAQPPVVSIIIVAHNEEAQVAETIASLVAGLDCPAEILLVDDSSTDATISAAVAAWPQIRVVPHPPFRLGVARARNIGAAAARAPVLVFADAHVRASPGWTSGLIRTLASAGVGAVAPAVTPLEGGAFGLGMVFEPNLDVEWVQPEPWRTRPVPALCGCFFAIRRDVFGWVGAFDEGFIQYGLEDLELSLRLWTFGYACMVEPVVQVRHLFRDTFRYTFDPVTALYNELRFAAVHYDAATLLHFAGTRSHYESFAPAFDRLIASDVGWRRQQVWSLRRASAEWYFDGLRRELEMTPAARW